MKKTFVIFTVLISTTLFSCKKDYICTCTTTIPGYTSSTSNTIKYTFKKNAVKNCEQNNSATNNTVCVLN